MRRRIPVLLWVFLALGCSQDAPLAPRVTPPPPPLPPPSHTNRPPSAVLLVSWWGQEGIASAGFTARGSADPDGDSLYFTWAFGDGTTITGTYVDQAHDYRDNGNYAVVLTVTDTHGATATANAQISISNGSPVLTSIDLATPVMPASVPMTATIHATYYDQGPDDNPVLSIDWGDGSVSTDTTHVYRAPGAYSLNLTVTDKDGASSSQGISRIVWVYDLGQTGSVPGYEVIDLGTLGGESSRPAALNNRGAVVGTSATGLGDVHAFLWRDGALTDITPPGEEAGDARRINDAGWIAGAGSSGQLPMWKEGVFTGFTSVPETEYGAWPVKILESGDVVVNIEKHEYPSPLFVRNGTVVNLGSLSSAGHGWAADINTRGQIVGGSAYQYAGAASYDFRAFLWEDGAMRELANLGTGPCANIPEQQCGHSAAADINDAGQIVGMAYNGTQFRAVLWDATDHTPHDLGFGTGASQALAINEHGQIAGDGLWESDEAFFRDTDGRVVSMGSLSGGTTRVAAMNEDGIVVGTSKTAVGADHAFVWQRDRGMRDLGAGPFGGKGVGTAAIAINDRGDILGYATPCVLYQGSYYCYAWSQSRAILWHRSESLVARRSAPQSGVEIVVFKQPLTRTDCGTQCSAVSKQAARSWRDRITPAGLRLP